MDTGKMIRVQVDGDKRGDRSGAYIGYSDGRPAGIIQNFKTGVKEKWVASGEFKSFDKTDLAVQRAKMEQNKADREKERNELHNLTSKKVTLEFENSRNGGDNHPYLIEKGVKNHGLKLDERGNLLMPLQDVDGKIWTVQHIGINGYKGFEPNGKKEGNFFIIGAKNIQDVEIPIICEGYATGASIHEALKKPIIVAVDAGNLENVAKAINAQFPSKNIVIAADNDIQKEEAGKDNVGKMKAEAAAAAVNAILVVPKLTPDEIKKGYTDFNDISKSRGLDEVAKQINIALSHTNTKEQAKPKDLSKNNDKSKEPLEHQKKRQISLSQSKGR